MLLRPFWQGKKIIKDQQAQSSSLVLLYHPTDPICVYGPVPSLLNYLLK